jgi:hypothetical protein
MASMALGCGIGGMDLVIWRALRVFDAVSPQLHPDGLAVVVDVPLLLGPRRSRLQGRSGTLYSQTAVPSATSSVTTNRDPLSCCSTRQPTSARSHSLPALVASGGRPGHPGHGRLAVPLPSPPPVGRSPSRGPVRRCQRQQLARTLLRIEQWNVERCTFGRHRPVGDYEHPPTSPGRQNPAGPQPVRDPASTGV